MNELNTKVAYDVAAKEVNDWLDYKCVEPADREENKASIDKLINAVMSGVLSIADDKTITHRLKFPLDNGEGQTTVRELTYKPRVSYGELSARTRGVKPGDLEGRVVAYIAVLTGQAPAVLMKLDTADMSICQAIFVFFTS